MLNNYNETDSATNGQFPELCDKIKTHKAKVFKVLTIQAL